MKKLASLLTINGLVPPMPIIDGEMITHKNHLQKVVYYSSKISLIKYAELFRLSIWCFRLLEVELPSTKKKTYI